MQFVETSLWNRLLTCRKRNYRMNRSEYCMSLNRPRAAYDGSCATVRTRKTYK